MAGSGKGGIGGFVSFDSVSFVYVNSTQSENLSSYM